eukprot:TRINITY_DN46731_c0_g1_i1.p1 TRINITY_DN46731_c0_g1~~TRINITY_DN46731_c0_g1_i1.p1  ORF type:complete len:518 (-),score=224.39 TRINITY_DN46731_c0_g1_i1:50-1570(-)
MNESQPLLLSASGSNQVMNSSGLGPGGGAVAGRRRRRSLAADEDEEQEYGRGAYHSLDVAGADAVDASAVSWPLVLCVVGCLLASSSQNVLRKIVASSMYNYRWFLVQALAVVSTVVCFVPSLHRWSAVTEQLRNVPARVFVVLGLLDCMHATLLVTSVAVVPAIYAVLIPQLVVPVTVLLRMMCGGDDRSESAAMGGMSPTRAKTTYKWTSVAGSLLSLAGLIVMVVPDSHAEHDQHTCQLAQTQIVSQRELNTNVVMLFLSSVPAAMSHVYRESVLLEHQVDVLGFNAYSSLAQTAWGFLLGPLLIRLQYSNSHLAGDRSTSVADTLHNIKQGLLCIVGHDSFSDDLCRSKAPMLGIELALFLLAIVATQACLAMLLELTKSEVVAHNTIIGSVAVAVGFFWLPVGNQALGESHLAWCGDPFSLLVIGGVVLTLLGLVLTHCKQPERQEHMDVKACLDNAVEISKQQHKAEQERYYRLVQQQQQQLAANAQYQTLRRQQSSIRG